MNLNRSTTVRTDDGPYPPAGQLALHGMASGIGGARNGRESPERLIDIKAASPPAREDRGTMFQHPLAREVAVAVAVKTLIVLAAGLLIFGPARPRITESGVAERLLAAPPPMPDRRPLP